MYTDRKIIEINTGDSAEIIQTCLTCDLPRCISRCPRIAKAKGKILPKLGKPGIMHPYKGGYMTVADAARLCGIGERTLAYRIQRNGLTLEAAIEKGKPAPRKRKEKEHEQE